MYLLFGISGHGLLDASNRLLLLRLTAPIDLRIKNITLSYKLPKKWVNQIFLNQMKAFVSIENVATFTSLPSGIDPERIEWNYPAFRTVSFGVNITL